VRSVRYSLLDLLVGLLRTTAVVESQVLHDVKVHDADCCPWWIVIQAKRLEDRLDGCLNGQLSGEGLV
jgi:hypothetical protein